MEALGWTLKEAQRIDRLAEFYPEPGERRRALELIQKGEHRWTDFLTRTPQGRVIDTSWMWVALRDGTRIGFGQDTTERKRAEEALRALSERLQAVREEERARIAREVHDEVGQALSALQMDTAWLTKKLESLRGGRAELSAKLLSMAALIKTIHDSVQRIATELRPASWTSWGWRPRWNGGCATLSNAPASPAGFGPISRMPASIRTVRRRFSGSFKRR